LNPPAIRELNGLTTLELQHKQKIILPVWYRITREMVVALSPPLADKLAIISDGLDVADVAIRLADVLRQSLHKS
jgi:hypothetical protein